MFSKNIPDQRCKTLFSNSCSSHSVVNWEMLKDQKAEIQTFLGLRYILRDLGTLIRAIGFGAN